MISRRRFFSLLAAPAIVRAASLMPISVAPPALASIVSVTVDGTMMFHHLSDGQTIGPLPVPALDWRWVGDSMVADSGPLFDLGAMR